MVPLELSAKERGQFEAALRPATTEKRIALRAQAALLLADDVATADVAKLLGVHLRTVMKWRARFSCPDPASRLADAPRSGRPPSLSQELTARR
jgi:transposase